MNLLPNSKYIDLKVLSISGQIFRMNPLPNKENEYSILHQTTVIHLKQVGEDIFFQTYPKNNNLELVYELFRIDVDFELIKKNIIKDDFVSTAIKSTGKLWLLKQDKWEMLISYIISQNKNFFHIKQCIENICIKFGKMLKTSVGNFYLFPSPSELSKASIEDLKNCKLGYRDEYIYRAVRKIINSPHLLSDIENMDNIQASETLTSFHGIGGKVADCILIFAYNRDDIVPYDTWLKRIMSDLYDIPLNTSYSSLRELNDKLFGKYAGWAQQYLFYHSRQVYKKNKSLKETWSDLI